MRSYSVRVAGQLATLQKMCSMQWQQVGWRRLGWAWCASILRERSAAVPLISSCLRGHCPCARAAARQSGADVGCRRRAVRRRAVRRGAASATMAAHRPPHRPVQIPPHLTIPSLRRTMRRGRGARCASLKTKSPRLLRSGPCPYSQPPHSLRRPHLPHAPQHVEPMPASLTTVRHTQAASHTPLSHTPLKLVPLLPRSSTQQRLAHFVSIATWANTGFSGRSREGRQSRGWRI